MHCGCIAEFCSIWNAVRRACSIWAGQLQMLQWDFSAEFSPELVGFGLSRLWTIDEHGLADFLDVKHHVPECPLSLQPFQDPVLLAGGFVYERKPVLKWLRTNETRTSPCTNEVLAHNTLMKLQPWRIAISSMYDTFEITQSLTSNDNNDPGRQHFTITRSLEANITTLRDCCSRGGEVVSNQCN